jgi:hypothetical protein
MDIMNGEFQKCHRLPYKVYLQKSWRTSRTRFYHLIPDGYQNARRGGVEVIRDETAPPVVIIQVVPE